LNTLVLLALVNGALYLFYKLKDSLAPRTDVGQKKSSHELAKHDRNALLQVYPGMTYEEVCSLVHETWDRNLEYEPFTGFKEREYAGRWVTVERNGFRHSKNNGPWPPDKRNLNIFVLGGSTTFGYGVADDQTIASHMQQALAGHSSREIKVYNFGRCYYYSTQERVLFCNLLAGGFVPDMAVFVDGPNDFVRITGEPNFTSAFHDFMDGKDSPHSGGNQGLLTQLPMARLVESFKSRFPSQHSDEETGPIPQTYDDMKIIGPTIDRYAQNKILIEAAALAHGVRTFFVWEPSPNYKYDLKYHLFRPPSYFNHTYAKYGYGYLARAVAESPKLYGADFLWLGDIQEKSTEPLYVDETHYTPRFSKEIGERVATFLMERRFGETAAAASRANPPVR
jgi:hypothetical protein